MKTHFKADSAYHLASILGSRALLKALAQYLAKRTTGETQAHWLYVQEISS